MNEKRIKQLEEFLKENPDDTFVMYALALEYVSQNFDRSLALFAKLLKAHPDYLPTYYHAAEAYCKAENFDLAKETYQKGIALAEATSELKALAELKNAYQNFLFELDE